MGSVRCFLHLHSLLLSVGTPPAFGIPANYAAVRSYTSGVHDTHKTYIREVRYQWHPWCGKQVYVYGEVRRGVVAVLRCTLDAFNRSASLEIPEWMFDSGYCSRMKAETISYVGVSALREVRALLSAAADHIESCVVEAQHLCRDSGGADADNISIQGPAGRTVPCAAATTEAFAGRLSADAPLVGTADEGTSQEGSSCSHTTGGER